MVESVPSPTSSQAGKKFLPHDQIDIIINPSAVREELRRGAPRIPEVLRAMYTYAICSPHKPRRKIFAILVLIDQVSSVSAFMENATDSMLPVFLLNNDTNPDNKPPSQNSMDCFRRMSEGVLHAFQTTQWIFLAPIFSQHPKNLQMLNLNPASILPFVRLEHGKRPLVFKGGFSCVRQVQIHAAHLQTPSNNGENQDNKPYFALKQLHSSDGDAYGAELSALQTTKRFEHPHIVHSLASYKRGGKKYFMFPWADCNLREYWDRNSNHIHRAGNDPAKWVLQQSIGLASCVGSFHNAGELYGRHGDIKPENILWFKSNEEYQGLGTLKLTDFGLATYHTSQALHTKDRYAHGTLVYSSPEVHQTRHASQSMDIWSLGCIFLEFLAWHALGLEGLRALSTSRTSTSTAIVGNNRFREAFFEMSNDGGQQQSTARLKPGVVRFINDLRAYSPISPCFEDILSFVQLRMLQTSPSKRAGASEVVSALTAFLARFEATLLNNGASATAYNFCFEDENWDEYGVKDALQHNLLADGIASPSTVANCSGLLSKPPSQSVWDGQNTSTIWSTSSMIPIQASSASMSIPACPEADTWSSTVDSGYYSMPFNTSEQFQTVDLSTVSQDRKRRLRSPFARSAACVKRNKRIANSSTHQVSTDIPSGFPEPVDLVNPSLFPCPFYHHNPAKYGTKSCMGPGWNISRLKEHIYRRHCLLEHVCQRCQTDFKSQSELNNHQKEFLCPELLQPVSGKICKLKKDQIRERRTKMPDAEKWVDMYRILFDCEPLIAPSLDKEISQPSQPTENPEMMTDFEHFLWKLLGDDDSSGQARACLGMIQKWRESQHATHPTQLSQDPFAVPHGEIRHIENASVLELTGYEMELFPDAGNQSIVPKPPDFESDNGDRSFLDNLHNTCDVTDQWLSGTFSNDLTGDLQGSFDTAAGGDMFIPGDWT